MVRPSRSGRGVGKGYNRRTRKTNYGTKNRRNSLSRVRKLHKTGPRKGKTTANRRYQDNRLRSRIQRKTYKQSAAVTRKDGRQRRRTQANKRVTLRTRNHNSRAEANTENSFVPCKKARLTINGKEIALSLSNHNVQDSGGSSSPSSAPAKDEFPASNEAWNLKKGWDEIIKVHPPAFLVNKNLGQWCYRPAALRAMKRRINENKPDKCPLPPHRKPVIYEDAKVSEYLETPVNRLYVYDETQKSICSVQTTYSARTDKNLTRIPNNDPFGRPGFFNKQAQEYYLRCAMCSEYGKKAMHALNHCDLYIREVNFEYTLQDDQKIFLAGRWRGFHLVEVFTPRYIVVGLKFFENLGTAEDNEFRINGCFPKRGVDDVYWALRGPHTPNAVYSINYNG